MLSSVPVISIIGRSNADPSTGVQGYPSSPSLKDPILARKEVQRSDSELWLLSLPRQLLSCKREAHATRQEAEAEG